MRALQGLSQLDKTDLSSSEVALLYALAHRDRNEQHVNLVWPTIKTLCWDTGLSRASVFRVLASLRKRGLIDIKRFGKSRVAYDLGGLTSKTGGLTSKTEGSHGRDPKYKEEEKEKEKLADAEEAPMKSSEVLSKFEKEPRKPEELLAHWQGKTKPRELGFFWRDGLAMYHEDMLPTVPLTTRQEKHLREMFGLVDDFHPRILYLLKRWVSFAKFVRAETNVPNVPAYPRVEFAYKHRQLWVQFTQSEPDESVHTCAQPKVDDVPDYSGGEEYDPTKDPESDEYQPQTLEELMAIINDDAD